MRALARCGPFDAVVNCAGRATDVGGDEPLRRANYQGVLNLIDRQIIAVLKPTIAADLGWTDNDYGTLAAWFQLGAAFGFLVAGWLVDRACRP